MLKLKESLSFLLLILIYNSVSGQGLLEEDSDLVKGFDKTIQFYQNSLGSDLQIYKGIEYLNYDKNIEGHQFFTTDVFSDGSVLYDDVLYTHVPIRYDIVKDELILKHLSGAYQIVLAFDFVKEFTFIHHEFIRITKDSLNRNIPSGFYDRIYQGKFDILAKRNKTIEEVKDGQFLQRSFLENNRYYLYRNGIYHPLKNKGSFVKLFKDKKKEILRYTRDNKINFRKMPESSFVKTAVYYDQLVN